MLIPRAALLRSHGAILVDGREVGDLLQCCHCQYTWRVQLGSGRVRGFCFRCMAVTCGKPECNPCTPFEQRLEQSEFRTS